MLITPTDKLLNELSDPSDDFVVIVEGERDREALEEIGVFRIAVLNRYGGVFELADRLAEEGIRRTVILTDFDRTGRILAGKIGDALLSAGIRVDWNLRAKIRKTFHITFVENLAKAVEEIKRGEIYGQNLHRLGKVPYSRKYRGKGTRGQTRRYRRHIRADGRSPRR